MIDIIYLLCWDCRLDMVYYILDIGYDMFDVIYYILDIVGWRC